MSDYKITFAPELNISAADFAESWNTLEQCRTVAEATTETATQQDFELISAGVLAGLTFVAGIAATALNELIKQTIAEYFKKRQAANNPPPTPTAIEIQQIEQPDGTKLLIVLIKQ
jgi:hypothetical protein